MSRHRCFSTRSAADALDRVDTVMRAPARALRHLPVLGRVVDAIPSPRDPLAPIVEAVVASNLIHARPLSIPAAYRDLVRRYIQDNPDDGAWLSRGLEAEPRFHTGGWLLSLQPKAAAMTVDTDVFVRDRHLPIRRYVHELVHVGQFRILGRTEFLRSYAVISVVTVAARWVRRQPLKIMNASPHEASAYAIDARFSAWLASEGGPTREPGPTKS